MAEILQLLIFLCAVFLACFYAPLLSAYGRVAWRSFADTLEEAERSMGERSHRVTNRYEHQRSRQQFMNWFDDSIDGEEPAGALDRDLLKARKETPIIRRLVQEHLPEAVSLCVSTHRLAAIAAGVSYIYEIALDPECFGLRERVIG